MKERHLSGRMGRLSPTRHGRSRTPHRRHGPSPNGSIRNSHGAKREVLIEAAYSFPPKAKLRPSASCAHAAYSISLSNQCAPKNNPMFSMVYCAYQKYRRDLVGGRSGRVRVQSPIHRKERRDQ